MMQANEGIRETAAVYDGSDEASAITSLSDRTWIGALSGFTLIILFWAIFGRIPETRVGKGLLIGPGNILRVFSEADGSVQSVLKKNGDSVKVGDVLVKLRIPDLELSVGNSKNFVESLDQTYNTLNAGSLKLLQIQEDDLKEQIKVINKQLAIRQEQINNYKKYLRNAQQLREKGGISEQDVLSAERDYSSQLEEIESLKIDQLKVVEMQRQLSLQNQEQRLSRDIDFIEKRSQAMLELSRLNRVRDIQATVNGTVFGLTLLPGDMIQKNQLAATIVFNANKGRVMHGIPSNTSDTYGSTTYAPDTAVIFFQNQDSHLIKPGDQLSLTPEGFSQEEFGGIRGQLVSISALPASRDSLIASTGSAVQADQLIQQGLIYSGIAKLEANGSNPSGYSWTGGRGPNQPITFGSSMRVNAIVRYRAPISYVFPFLRDWTGLLRT